MKYLTMLFRGDRLDALDEFQTTNDSGEARPTSPLTPAKKSGGARLFAHRGSVRNFVVAAILLCSSVCSWADDVSGPGHTTLRRTAWGSFFYDSAAGAHRLEALGDELRLRSGSLEVRLEGSEYNGYRLSCGRDQLAVKYSSGDLEIRWGNRFWTVRKQNGDCVLESNSPKEKVRFERSANEFSIRGMAGQLRVVANPGELRIRSSAGDSLISENAGSRSLSGAPLAKLPYLGRGVYISFHGVGVLIDMQRLFPMPELFQWVEWRPLIGEAF